MSSLVPLVRALTHHKGPTITTSFNPNHLPNAPSPNPSQWGGWGPGFQQMDLGAHNSAHRTPTLENFYKKIQGDSAGLGLKALSCLSSQDCGTIKEARRRRKRHFELFGRVARQRRGVGGGGVFQSLLGQTGVGQATSPGSAGCKEHLLFGHESRQRCEPAPTCLALRGRVWPHHAP